MQINTIKSFAEIEAYAIENNFDIQEEGKQVIGQNFIVLSHQTKDIIISFVLVSANANEYFYKVIYSDLSIKDEDENNITLNKIELASELAHKATVDELVLNGDYNSEDDLHNFDDEDVLTYKEEVQDVFNRWYDFYIDEIEKVKY